MSPLTDTNMLVTKKILGPNTNPIGPFALLCLCYAQHGSLSEQVEYDSRWALSCWHRVGHVNFYCLSPVPSIV